MTRAKSGRDRQDGSSGACHKIKDVEKLGNPCPLLSASFWTAASLEVSAGGERQEMKMGQKWFTLGPATTLNGFITGNCHLGISNFLNDPNSTAREHLINLKAI